MSADFSFEWNTEQNPGHCNSGGERLQSRACTVNTDTGSLKRDRIFAVWPLQTVLQDCSHMTIPKEVTADTQRTFKSFFVEIPWFPPNSKDHVGPTQPWGNGSRGRILGLVLWPLPVARCKLGSSQAGENGASGKELPRHAGTSLSMEFPRVLTESSYGFFQVQINKKLTGLLWACAATSKQPGDLHNCLKSHPAREELLHPYVCMEVCVYIHTYTVQNTKSFFFT